MKWSKPLMTDKDDGIEYCPVHPYSAGPCSPTVIKIYEACPDQYTFYI